MALNEYDEILQSGGDRPGSVNEYDSMLQDQNSDQASQVKNSMTFAQDSDPGRQAEVLNLSKEYGLPASIVSRQYDTLKKKKNIESLDYNSMAFNNPGSSKFLSKPENAALVQNEVDKISGVEDALSIFVDQKAKPRGFMSDLSGAAQTGYNNLVASTLALGPAYGVVKIEDYADKIAEYNKKARDFKEQEPTYTKSFLEKFTPEAKDVGREFSKWMESIPLYFQGKKAQFVQDYIVGQGRTIAELIDLFNKSIDSMDDVKGLLYTTTESLAYSFPSLVGFAGGSLVAGPVGGAGGTFAGSVVTETGSWINQQLESRGYDMTDPKQIIAAYSNPELISEIRSQAERKGLGTASVDAIFSLFAGKIRIGGESLGSKIASKVVDVGTQMVGESASEGAGQLAAYEGDTSKIDSADVILEGFASLGHSIGEIGIGSSKEFIGITKDRVTKLREKYSKDPVEAMSEVSKETKLTLEDLQKLEGIQKAGKLVSETKDIGKVDGKIEELVGHITETSGSRDVFFQSDDWENYWSKKGISPSEAANQILGDSGKSFFESKQNGTPMEVPLGKLLEKTKGGEHFDGLSSVARVSVDGPNLSEIRDHIRSLPQLIDEIANETVSTQPKETDIDSQASNFRKNIEEQLRAASPKELSANDIKAQAQVWEERIKRRSEILGVTPDQLVDKYPVMIGKGDINQSEGITLDQKDRGRIQFTDSSMRIDLMKDANFSTFLHETGHAWLEEIKQDFNTLKKSGNELNIDQQQFIKDSETILNHFGLSSFDEIQTEHHEQWAEMAEVYFREGKAPSEQLRKAFARFKVWLTAIYQQIAGVKAPLSRDIREVMNRLLASDNVIDEVQNESGLDPLFEDALAAGMNQVDAERYANAAEEAKAAASEILSERMVKEWENQQSQQFKELRSSVKEQVRNEIENERVYKALDTLRYGTTIDGSSMKLSREILVKSFDAEFIKSLPKPFIYSRDGGMHPEVAAEMLGYRNAREMLEEISMAPNKNDIIELTTDARMAQSYPNLLSDYKKLKQDAVRYVHNNKQEELLRLELEYLGKENLKALKDSASKLIYSRIPSVKEIKLEASKILEGRPVTDIKPNIYLRASTKSSKNAANLFKRGDIQGAFKEKRKQIINFELYLQSLQAQEKIDKAKDRFSKLFQKDEQLAKTRDINFILAARAILESYGLGKGPDKTIEEILNPIKSYDQGSYSTIAELVNNSMRPQNKPISQVTYSDFVDLDLAISSLWDLSKSSKQIQIDGVKQSIDSARDELIQGLDRFRKEKKHGAYNKAATKWEKTKRGLLGIKAMLRRTEHWVDAMDGGDQTGVFRKYIWNPISEASDQFTDVKAQYLNRFKDLVSKVDIGDETPIQSPELNYEFKNKAEILGAMLHTGNESNMTKLLVGRAWGDLVDNQTLNKTKWDQFINRMYKEGVIGKSDWDFIQGVWDLMEDLKPEAQRAHKEMFGHYFSEITSREFDTPFGKYRGGYAPAVVDSFLVDDIATKKDQEELVGGNNSFAYPTAGGKGFTKSRVQAYNKPLSLDIKLFGSHLDQTLRFSILKPRVAEVARLIINNDFKNAMQDIDSAVINEMLRPFLQRADKQLVQNPIVGHGAKAANRFISVVRTRAAMQIMFANAGNVIEQLSGFSVAAIKVSPRFLRNGLWQYLRNSKSLTNNISEKSKYMSQRFSNQVYELSKATDDIIENKSDIQKAGEFAVKHMYFFQQVFQNVIDASIWHGAYNQAIEQGMSETESVRYSDSVIRQTQSSMRPIDIAAVEANPWVKVFQMFYGYFNMLSNTSSTEFSKLIYSDMSIKKKMARGFYAYTLVIAAPAIYSALLKSALSGKIDSDDDDEYMDDFLDIFFGSQFRVGTAMFPFVGPALQSGFNKYNDKWYDDRVSASPAIEAISQTIGAPVSVYNAAKGGSRKKAIRDALGAMGILTGTPVGSLSRPIGYLSDVGEGKTKPTGPVDFARGLISGK